MKKALISLIVFFSLVGISFSEMWLGVNAPYAGDKRFGSEKAGSSEQKFGVRVTGEYKFGLPYLSYKCPACGQVVSAPLGNAPALGIEISAGYDWGISGEKVDTAGEIENEWKRDGIVMSAILKYHFPTDEGKKMHLSVGSGPEIAMLKEYTKDLNEDPPTYGEEGAEITNLRFIAPIVLDYDLNPEAETPIRMSFILTLGGSLISTASTSQINIEYGLGIGLKRKF